MAETDAEGQMSGPFSCFVYMAGFLDSSLLAVE
jgi:hypothetical protein